MVMFQKAVAILCLLPTIVAAEPTSKVSLVENPFKEVLRSGAEISGARLVGLVSTSEERPKGNSPQVSALVPKDWRGADLCLEVISIDGLYESRNTYTVAADWVGGPSELYYPSSHKEAALAYSGGQIAGLVARGNCAAPLQEVAPVFWGTQPEKSSILYMLLNTARSEETFLSFPDLPEIENVTCELIQADQRNAFDTRCALPFNISAHGHVEAVAVSFKNGEMGPDVSMHLRFGQQP